MCCVRMLTQTNTKLFLSIQSWKLSFDLQALIPSQGQGIIYNSWGSSKEKYTTVRELIKKQGRTQDFDKGCLKSPKKISISNIHMEYGPYLVLF